MGIMLVGLKDKAQVTIPKTVINQLGLSRGDMLDVVGDGSVKLVPVLVYPKVEAERLEALASAARRQAATGEATACGNVEDSVADLHEAI